MLQILTSPEPLTLTIDNNLLYPPPPSNALYHLPRILTWSGNEIYLARSLPVSARTGASLASARDLALYTMRRTPFTYEVSLLPRREGLKSAVMRGRRSFLGNLTWDVEVKGAKMFRYSKGRWKTPEGRVIATEKEKPPDEKGETSDWQPVREEITIEGEDVELWMKDLIVAAWCARVWQGTGRLSFARTLMRGQGKLSLLLSMSFSLETNVHPVSWPITLLQLLI
jgi:hypothetical protein